MSKNNSDAFGPLLRQLRLEKSLHKTSSVKLLLHHPISACLKTGALEVRSGAMLDVMEERLKLRSEKLSKGLDL